MFSFEEMINAALFYTPFREYSDHINFSAVFVADTISGARKDGVNEPGNTNFGAYYYCGGISRLLCIDSERLNAFLDTVKISHVFFSTLSGFQRHMFLTSKKNKNFFHQIIFRTIKGQVI